MRRILIVPLIAGILFSLSACGAKEETTTSAPAAKSSTDADETPTTEASTTDETTEDDTSDTTEDDGGSGTGSVGDLPTGLDNDCIAISTLYVSIMAQSTSLMVPGAVAADELEKLEKELEEARANADVPDEIAEDFEVWSAAWAEFGQAMGEMSEGGILDPENAAKIEEATKQIEDPEVEAAGKRIEEYVTEKCAGGGLTDP